MKEENSFVNSTAHHGRNIKRVMDEKGVRPEVLEQALGLSAVSLIKLLKEKSLNDITLEKVAKALNVPVETIKELSEDNISISNVVENNTYNVENKDQAASNINNGPTRDTDNRSEGIQVDKMIAAYSLMFQSAVKDRDKLAERVSELEKLLNIQKENESVKEQNILLKKRVNELEKKLNNYDKDE